MSQLNYNLQVSIDPPKCKRGQTVTITVKISDLTGDVASVNLLIPKYGIIQKIPRVSPDTFSLSKAIPMLVPKGVYCGIVYAADPNGNKGPSKEMCYEIV